MANYYVNLVDGNDTTGNGTIATPWKTITKATAVGGARVIGDVVYVTKTPGTVTLIGTGTTSNIQSTINTTADYTGSLAVKDYISLSADGFPLYQIATITSTVITIQGTPWFEAGNDTGLSTVSIYKVPTLDYATGTGNWDSLGVSGNEIAGIRNTPFDYNPTFGYNILISGGWSTDFTVQDGHTLIKNSTPAAGVTSGTFLRGNTGIDGYKINRISGLNFINFYTGALTNENRMVWDDCIFGYNTQSGISSCLIKNSRSYCPVNSYRFPLIPGDQTMYAGNTPTETGAIRPACETHTHFLSYTEYSITTSGTPATQNRQYSYIKVKDLTLKSALRSTDYVAGESNIGKVPILPNSGAARVILDGCTITKNANVGPIARIFGPTSANNCSITMDCTSLNSVSYSATFNLMARLQNYIKSTNGNLLTLPGTFKVNQAGDNGGMYPYCNNVVINNDNTRYQWDGPFLSSVDNTVYNTGSNSVKLTKTTNYVTQNNSYFIGDIELTNTPKTISVSLRGSKAITNVTLCAFLLPVQLGGGFFGLTSTNYNSTIVSSLGAQNINSSIITLSSSTWTTLSVTVPGNTVNAGGKLKLALVTTGGSNMLAGDNIWIDSVTIV